MKKTKIPKTDSIKELANFFQTHELADFEDELVEVSEPVFVRRTGIRIHLEPHELKEIKVLAEAQGVIVDNEHRVLAARTAIDVDPRYKCAAIRGRAFRYFRQKANREFGSVPRFAFDRDGTAHPFT